MPLACECVQNHGLGKSLCGVDVILVDEAQDCNGENYDLVCVLAKEADATVVMIGDANQCLYRFRNASPDFLLTHAGFKHVLATNFRSSPQIVAMSSKFMRHPICVKANPGARHGPLPHLIVRKPSAALDAVLGAVQAPGAGSVMLIGRSKQPRYEQDTLVRMGLQTVVNEMHRRGVPYKRMFKETSDDEPLAGGQNMDPGGVNVMTIHGSKGLEADTVVVIDAVQELAGEFEVQDQMEVMYVAMSRSRRNLTVVNLEGGLCDSTLAKCVDEQLCTLDGHIDSGALAVTRNIKQKHTVTQLLSDRTIINERSLLDLARMVIEECKVVGRAEEGAMTHVERLPEATDLRTFYGQLAENCLQMAYNSTRSSTPECNIIQRLEDFVCCRIIIPSNMESAFRSLFACAGASVGDAVSRSTLADLKTDLSDRQQTFNYMTRFIDHVTTEMDRRGMDRAVVLPTSLTQVVCVPELVRLAQQYNSARSNNDRLPYLFRAALFFFQFHQHAGYRWSRDYNEHIRAFRPLLQRIVRMSRLLPENCTFEKQVHFRSLRLSGRMDVAASSRIIEAKFSSSLSLLHFLQPSFYGLLNGGKYSRKCETWNLATGERVVVRFKDLPEQRWRIIAFLARCLDRKVAVSDLTATPLADGFTRLQSESLRACCTTNDPDQEIAMCDTGVHGVTWPQS